jgi:hypothetical protein
MAPIMIIGSPRSGTTWTASLFDSHPGTLYLHEPDVVETEPRFPFVPLDPPPGINAIARAYFARLAANRSARTVNSPEIFPKAYRSATATALRAAWMRGLRLAGWGLRGIERSRRIQVPDLARRGSRPRLVIKSVDSVSRLPSFARALPDVRFVYIVRHPCGVVASQLRGVELGRMARQSIPGDVLALPTAAEAGLDRAKAASLSAHAAVAWLWRLTNDWVYRQVAPLPNVYVLVYDRIATNLDAETAALFDWAGLDLGAQTQAYLDRLRGIDSSGARYFSIRQNPAEAASKWRRQLAPEVRAEVEAIAADSQVGRLFDLPLPLAA